jgi:hypothetical protein
MHGNCRTVFLVCNLRFAMLSGLTESTRDWPESIGDYTSADDWNNPDLEKDDKNGQNEKTAANS